MDWLWLLILGFGTGVYGVLVGAGGGFVLGPALLIFFDMEPRIVAGTALALVAINSASGSIAYRRMGLVDYRSGLLFAAAAMPGSVLAPFVVAEVAGDLFRILFGLLLIGVAIRIVVPHREAPAPGEERPTTGAMVRRRQIVSDTGQVFRYEFNEALATSFNVVLGFISSFFGTGGGFLRTPILISTFGFPVRVAVATSVFTLAFYTTAGAVTHAALGHIDWYPTLAWAGIGLIAGGQVGAAAAGRVRGQWIIRLLLVLVVAMGIRLLVEGIAG